MKERPRSKELFDRARRLMPGGVSSPVRAYQPYPSFMVKGDGSSIFDVDGNEYLDFSMGFEPLILGHSDPDVLAALHRQVSMAALLGTLQFTIAALISSLVGHLHDGTALPLAMVMFACGGGAYLLLRTLTGPHTPDSA